MVDLRAVHKEEDNDLNPAWYLKSDCCEKQEYMPNRDRLTLEHPEDLD